MVLWGAGERGQPVRANLRHASEHQNGVGSSEHRSEHHARVLVKVNWHGKAYTTNVHIINTLGKMPKTPRISTWPKNLAQHVEVRVEKLREVQRRQLDELQHHWRKCPRSGAFSLIATSTMYVYGDESTAAGTG